MKHWMYVIFTGFIWMFMGVFLTMKGTSFLSLANLEAGSFSLIIFSSLSIGLLKSHFILKKVVKRITARIFSFPLPISIFKIYDKKFYILIFLMIILGSALKSFPIHLGVRGGIDLAIGIALMKGGIDYFIAGLSFKKNYYR